MTSLTASKESPGLVRLADRASDYSRLGIDPVDVAAFEDGLRTDGARGGYEWWYFDAHLDDGAKLVVVFYTKTPLKPGGPLAPMITISLDLPDGRSIAKTLNAAPQAFQAARQGCDVRIGENRFVGDLHAYRIAAAIEDMSVDIELVGEVRPWRPKTGHTLFGPEGKEHFFAWLVSVPQGRVTATYRIGREEHRTAGVGYHDHNWGDAPMQKLIHNWYWGRAKAGPYTVIAAYITATADYGYEPEIVFLLAKDGEMVVDDESKVVFSTGRVGPDGVTGKPVADITRYEYRDGQDRYVITFERQKTILHGRFVDDQPLWKRLAAKVIRSDGAYHRFTGKLTLERFMGAEVVETFEEEALWELMYFGHARTPAA
ncbi:MAG: hypothetical protein WA005_04640 [Candidatus Binataceae bacterium]